MNEAVAPVVHKWHIFLLVDNQVTRLPLGEIRRHFPSHIQHKGLTQPCSSEVQCTPSMHKAKGDPWNWTNFMSKIFIFFYWNQSSFDDYATYIYLWYNIFGYVIWFILMFDGKNNVIFIANSIGFRILKHFWVCLWECFQKDLEQERSILNVSGTVGSTTGGLGIVNLHRQRNGTLNHHGNTPLSVSVVAIRMVWQSGKDLLWMWMAPCHALGSQA